MKYKRKKKLQEADQDLLDEMLIDKLTLDKDFDNNWGDDEIQEYANECRHTRAERWSYLQDKGVTTF